ncbi:hypothetical protein PG989_004793 [Apiospora arundinis]
MHPVLDAVNGHTPLDLELKIDTKPFSTPHDVVLDADGIPAVDDYRTLSSICQSFIPALRSLSAHYAAAGAAPAAADLCMSY